MEQIKKILNLPQDVPLTGAQTAEVLDILLHRALQPIFLSSNCMKIPLAQISYQITLNQRRKFSSLPTSELQPKLYSLFLSNNKDSFDLFVECKLQRDIKFKMLNWYLDSKDIQNSVDSSCREYVYDNAIYYLNLYKKFRDRVIAKFYRLAYKEAKKRKSVNENIDLNDLFKNLVIAIQVALDRYDSEKGSLPSYISTWFQHFIRDPDSGYEYGQAIVLNYYEKKDLVNKAKSKDNLVNTFSVNLDDVFAGGFDIEDENNRLDKLDYNNDRFKKLMSIIHNTPGTDIACLVLGLNS